MPRVSKNTKKLEAVKHLMGNLPDHKVAEEAGVTASAVGRFRRKHGISAYEGYKFGVRGDEEGEGAEAAASGDAPEVPAEVEAPAEAETSSGKGRRGRGPDKKLRKSKLSPFYDELGKVADREIAEKAQVSVEAVRMYRRRHGIELEDSARAARRGAKSGRPRRRTSKLDPYRDQLGRIPDREVAELAGVTAENVRSYRRRHSIAAEWRTAEKAPVAQVAVVEAPVVTTEVALPAPVAVAVVVSAAGESQGFAVTVQDNGATSEYFIVDTNITAAVARAVDLVGVRHPDGQVTGVRHLGIAIG